MISIPFDSPRYPPLVALVPDPPPRLWLEGRPSLLARTAVAIVGSRAATALGVRMAEELAAGLAARGLVVVSGCARGIDATAHRAALEVGGDTVAVLAGGLDVAVPYGNRGLARRIAREGCLVSEHPPGRAPAKYLFPLRNRIIAGLARVVIVVEASRKSGALTTARHALAAGREVMAVPGHPLLPNAGGVNQLLFDGARPALSVDDVIEELGRLPPVEALEPWDPTTHGPSARGLVSESARGEGLGRRLLQALGEVAEPAEALAERAGAPLPVVLAELTELELKGLVRSWPGQRYGRPPPRKSKDTAVL